VIISFGVSSKRRYSSIDQVQFIELKVPAEYEIAAIPPEMVRCPINKFKTRLHGIIFKTK
jgi:hypothetical protein